LFHKSLKNFSSVASVKELQSETGQLLKAPLKEYIKRLNEH